MEGTRGGRNHEGLGVREWEIGGLQGRYGGKRGSPKEGRRRGARVRK